MKRFIIFLLIAVLTAFPLAACGGAKDSDDSDPSDRNQSGSGEDTNNADWNGVYTQTESYQAERIFMEILDCDGESFKFEFYSKETADDEKFIYLDGAATAVIRPDDSYKADYEGMTFSMNADSGEITADGSDYGVVDGIYARYENAELESSDIIGEVAPCGIIFGSPLYIGYAADFGDALDGKAAVAESYPDGTGEEKIWIYSPEGIAEAAIVAVSYEDDEWIANGQRLAMPLKGDEILELVTTVPEGSYPNEAIVCYSEDMETQYAYAVGWNGKTGGVNAYLIEITGVGEAWYSK